MQSTRSSHIWLIQPNDPIPSITPIDVAGGDSVRFSPSWTMVCLQAYLRERTGHTCQYIDARLFDSTEAALEKLNGSTYKKSNEVAVIYSTVSNLGYAVEISNALREKYPHIVIIFCGPFVSSFPECIDALPNIDFGLSGDPEIILRNLMEYCDVEQRLKQISGLLIPGTGLNKSPHWVSDLKLLSLPKWDGTLWSNYETELHSNGVRIQLRLSRGNTGEPVDAAFPGYQQPLRVLPMQSMASLIHRCPGYGVEEVFFADSPGFWSSERISEWCEQLDEFRNSQSWAFQMIPREMPDEEITKLANRGCRRIELVIPSFDQDTRAALNYSLNDKQLNQLIAKLAKNFIKPQLIYWIQGPKAGLNEAGMIFRHIKSSHAFDFSIYPFPLHFDSALYHAARERGEKIPDLSEWLSWARSSGALPLPPDIWTGKEGLANGLKTINLIQRKMVQNPWLRVLRFVKKHRVNALSYFQRKQPNFSVRNPDSTDL